MLNSSIILKFSDQAFFPLNLLILKEHTFHKYQGILFDPTLFVCSFIKTGWLKIMCDAINKLMQEKKFLCQGSKNLQPSEQSVCSHN